MVRGRFDLREHLEQTRKHLRGYPLAGVAYPDDELSSLSPCRDRDATSFLRVFAGVCQEVSEDLFQPCRVAFDQHGLAGHRDDQLMPPLRSEEHTSELQSLTNLV